MKCKRIFAMIAMVSLVLVGCSKGNVNSTMQDDAGENTEKSETEVITSLSRIDNSKWNYNESDGVYWQVGISYCEHPAAEEYETLGVFVPEAYMTGTDNGDGTYTCQMNEEGKVNDYTKAGFIYVNAGCRGRNEGAPAGVTDLKAAVRYIRYNEGNIPGSIDRIFTFGMSGGGAQSALMGATGDSELYTPYLQAIGAVEGVSDAVAGSMCWCPITNLDYADEAYEWNMGVTRSNLDEDMQALSDGMAEAFAQYINELGLKDSEGNVLTLTQS